MKRIVVGVSGASGIPYAQRLLEELARITAVETHLVISAGAREVMRREGYEPDQLERLAAFSYNPADLGAVLASGSFRTSGMVIVPASATTAGKLAAGIADNLLLRAAYVHIKEKRPLILLLRETPLPLPSLQALVTLAQAGVIVMPASPGFYNQPNKIKDLLDFMVQRILDHLSLNASGPRWEG